MTHDPISDLLTRIRNAGSSKHLTCSVPASNLKLRIVKLLKVQGYLKNYKLIKDDKQGIIKIALRYRPTGEPVYTEIKRISKLSVRRYAKATEYSRFHKGFGILVVSTSQGVMTDREATLKNVGGEVLFSIN